MQINNPRQQFMSRQMDRKFFGLRRKINFIKIMTHAVISGYQLFVIIREIVANAAEIDNNNSPTFQNIPSQ